MLCFTWSGTCCFLGLRVICNLTIVSHISLTFIFFYVFVILYINFLQYLSYRVSLGVVL